MVQWLECFTEAVGVAGDARVPQLVTFAFESDDDKPDPGMKVRALPLARHGVGDGWCWRRLKCMAATKGVRLVLSILRYIYIGAGTKVRWPVHRRYTYSTGTGGVIG